MRDESHYPPEVRETLYRLRESLKESAIDAGRMAQAYRELQREINELREVNRRLRDMFARAE